MKDGTFTRSDDRNAATGNEHLMARFGSRTDAEVAVERLREIGVPTAGIAVKEGKATMPAARPRLHLGEGLILGIVVCGLLGALMGALFSAPTQQLILAGQTFFAEAAGAVSGLGVGIILGVLLGIVVGLLSRTTATSPIAQFEELSADGMLVEVSVPASLAPRAREILNAI